MRDGDSRLSRMMPSCGAKVTEVTTEPSFTSGACVPRIFSSSWPKDTLWVCWVELTSAKPSA